MNALLLVFLFAKHFVVDFLLQTPYQYLNKGKLGHPGGLLHAGLHIMATWLVLVSLRLHVPLWIYPLEFLVHYFTDFGKVRINQANGWTATTHNEFWILLGADQFIHYLTYALIVVIT